VLQRIQPSNGGFLEATPLTSFVTMSLASIGLADHPVARKGVSFIVQSVRPDGSWPIDTNLATWVTTLAVNALAAADDLDQLDKQGEVHDWLLAQQYRVRHPYTGAAPGGWAWTPLPGGVPDADDTSGALLALGNLKASLALPHPSLEGSPLGQEFSSWREVFGRAGAEPALTLLGSTETWMANQAALGEAGSDAVDWLLRLQNRNGGWPTFCRGWGHLPFDRSGSDLTAHALRAFAAAGMTPDPTETVRQSTDPQMHRGLAYLARSQRSDGSWLPLWFGNQHAPDDENPTYGTARVLAAYRDLAKMDSEPARRGVAWLLSSQNPDGGWGGAPGVPSSVEETALAVEILLDAPGADAPGSPQEEPVNKGLAWLVQQIGDGALQHPTPIGFYFAKLWYFERLYPIIFSVACLGRARRKLSSRPDLAHREGTPS
jgi:squalene-hopene/tetraprenyl-beta-curcumene cyclase